MKKIFGLVFLVFFGFKGFSLGHDARIIITYPRNQGVWVQVDGKRYNGYDNSVVISNLRPGRHQIKVYSKGSSRNSGIFGIFGNRDRLIYSNNLNVKPGYNVHVDIDRYGKARVDEQHMNSRIRRDHDDRDYRDRDYRNRDDRDRDDCDRDNRDWDYRGRDNRSRDDRDRDDWSHSDVDGRQVLHGEFLRMMEKLRWENGEQERLSLAKEYVQRHEFTSEQVKQLVQLFNYDSQKLELASHAYRNTVDKGNYSILFDVFRSKKSKKELEKFIKNFS